jgi:hypothetical protein
MTTASASSTLKGEDKDARTTVLDAARPRARGSDRAGDGADARASMTAASIDRSIGRRGTRARLLLQIELLELFGD